jgi:YegS/Rv2252/BmrU family lipid kinase
MAVLLLNRQAGGGRAVALEPRLRQALAAHGGTVELVCPPDAEAARACVAGLPGGTRVVVVGGDGTLHQLLPALLAGGHELGLVPSGSGDDGARALGIRGMPWRRALEHALVAPARAVDVGEVRTEGETRPFLSSMALGFDAAVATRAMRGPRWLGGLPRYLLATLQEIAHLRLHELVVETDGERVHQGPALLASTLNTASYGGGMPAVPHARVDDGRLDLLLAGDFSRLGALAMLPRLLVGRHLAHPRIRCVSFAEARFSAADPVPLAADGETLTASRSVAIRVRPQALRVVAGPLAATPEP